MLEMCMCMSNPLPRSLPPHFPPVGKEISMGHRIFHGPWKFPGAMEISRTWKFPGAPGNFHGEYKHHRHGNFQDLEISRGIKAYQIKYIHPPPSSRFSKFCIVAWLHFWMISNFHFESINLKTFTFNMYYVLYILCNKDFYWRGHFQNHKKGNRKLFYVNASSIVSCAINISIEKGIFKTTRKETTMFFYLNASRITSCVIKIFVEKGHFQNHKKGNHSFLCEWVRHCNLCNKDFCWKGHF